MKRFLALLAVGAACLVYSINAAPEPLPVLYDSSIKTPTPNASSSETSRVYKELLRTGGVALTQICVDDKLPVTPQLIGLSKGSFTRKGAAQVAWLFQLCYVKGYSATGFFGLVIVENQQTVRVSSLLYDDAEITGVTEFYSLRDINLNGTDELALVSSLGDGGYIERKLTLLEQTPKNLTALGLLPVYLRNSYREPIYIDDWKVFVIKGKPPVFIATLKSGKGSPVKLTLDKPSLELQTFLVR